MKSPMYRHQKISIAMTSTCTAETDESLFNLEKASTYHLIAYIGLFRNLVYEIISNLKDNALDTDTYFREQADISKKIIGTPDAKNEMLQSIATYNIAMRRKNA